MSVAANKETVRTLNDEVWLGGNLGAIDEHVAPGYVGRLGTGIELSGREGYRQNVETMHRAFSHREHVEIFLVGERDRVACQWTVSAVHDGPLALGDGGELPATGRAVRLSGMTISRFENGTIAEEWAQVDVLSLLQQLGVVEPPT